MCIDRSKNEFWKDVFKSCYKLSVKLDTDTLNENTILKLPLWYNKKSLVGKKPV